MGRTIPADSPRKQRKARTREKILAAGKALFERDGYKAATIRGIAAEAGMSTGAVFANFTDKDDLYVALYGHKPITPEQGRALMEAQTMGAELNTPDFLRWIAARLVDVHGENPNTDYVLSLHARADAGEAAISQVKR